MEMLVVVVIIGVFSAIAIPRVTSLVARNKVSGASATVQRDLERAFSLAARLRRSVTLVADNSGKYYQVADAVGGTVRLNRNLAQSEGIGVETVTFSPTTLTIHPNGIASGPLTVTLTSHGATRVVTMTRVGLIRRSQ